MFLELTVFAGDLHFSALVRAQGLAVECEHLGVLLVAAEVVRRESLQYPRHARRGGGELFAKVQLLLVELQHLPTEQLGNHLEEKRRALSTCVDIFANGGSID